METDSSGRGLVFLISQPRSGSTLLQRMLGAHPDIATIGEPWLALHAAMPLRPDLWKATFNENTFLTAFEDLPGGRELYIKTARQHLLNHYSTWSRDQDKRVFLDKTPRYYYIIPELREMFPQSKIIVLLRNPLAVLTSISKTWVGDRWYHLYDSRDDLLKAPGLLAQAIKEPGLVDHVLTYESLVSQPEPSLRQLFQCIDLPWDDIVMAYHQKDQQRWSLGDPSNAHRKAAPDSSHKDRWTASLSDAQSWRCAQDYLDQLGESVCEAFGYEHNDLQRILDQNRPTQAQYLTSLSLGELLRVHPDQRSQWQYELLQYRNRVREMGWRGTLIDSFLRAGNKARRLIKRPIKTNPIGDDPTADVQPMSSNDESAFVRSDRQHEPVVQSISSAAEDLDPDGRRRIPRAVRVDRLSRRSKPAA